MVSRPGALFDVINGTVGVDIETASRAEIKDLGAWAYSRHPSTKVYVVCWCYMEGGRPQEVNRWTPGDGPLPDGLVAYLLAGGRVLAHNASFEIAIWTNILVPDFGFPEVDVEQWLDSQSIGLELNLPAKLEGLAKALGTPVEKDNEGHRLMMKLARLDDDGRPVHRGKDWDTPENRERLALYCDRDVLAMCHAWARMSPLTATEERVRRLDQKINARGVYLDQAYAMKLRRMAEKRSDRLADEAVRATSFECANATEPRALKAWLKRRQIDLPLVTRKKPDGTFHKTESTDKTAVAMMLERDNLPEDVRGVLELRLEATKTTSLAKLARVEVMVGADGRLRNALQFHAAHTGRWSSTGLQIHNLPKDKLGPGASGLVGLLVEREDLDALEIVEQRPLNVLSQKLRSVIAAAPGMDLIAADFSAIEARVLAWLAGQDDAVGFFHQFDRELLAWEKAGRPKGGKPTDYYEFTAAGIGSKDRQLGKVAALALGYQMGAMKFHSTAADWGVPIERKLARKVQKAWRETNVMVKRFWDELQSAVITVVDDRDKVVAVGDFLRVYGNPHCVFIRLPSGRVIRYWRPSVRSTIKKGKRIDDEGAIVPFEFETTEIRFWTQNPSKNGMTIETTYGGKLAENVTQAVARDLLAEGLLRVEAAGYPVVMHVHDSIASEVPEGTGNVDEFCWLMADLPQWAGGCPVAAEGYRAKRFRG